MHNFRGKFDARLQSLKAVAELLQGVHPHVGTFATVTVFISDEVKLLAGREFFKRVADATLSHNDELVGRLSRAPIDNGRCGANEIGHAQNVAGALGMRGN